MRFVGLLLFSILPLLGQDASPDPSDTSAIAPVAPVPLPTDIDLLAAEDMAPARPESVALTFAGGGDFIKATETFTSRGAVTAVADTGMVLKADRGSYNGKSKILKVDGNVKLRTETGIEILADHGVLDDTAETVVLTGDVSVYQGSTLQRGERIVFLIKENKIDASELRTSVDPILLEAGRFSMEERNGQDVYVGRDAGITTHDVEEPGFWMRASETTIYPEDRVTFKNLKLYAGGTPIFWLPYFSQPLDADLGYHFVPGARSNWGMFLLNSYGIMLGEGDGASGDDAWLLSKWNFDLRSRRGVGFGVDLIDRRMQGNRNMSGLSLYYTNDLDPNLSRTGIPRPFINEDRWRARLQYRVPLSWENGDQWRVDANLDALSDNFYLEDFDPRAFQVDPAPDNTLGLFRRGDSSLFGLVARLRPNDFYRSDSRIEASLDQSRRPLFGTRILHEGRTSLSYIEEEIGSASRATARAALAATGPQLATLLNQLPAYERQLVSTMRSLPPGSSALRSLRNQLLSPSYARLHTYQELSMPTKIGGWLNFTPEIGAGYTHYGSVSGPSNSTGRHHLYAGAEASVKFSKSFGDYRNRNLGLDGLLHIFQPYARFSFLETENLSPLFPAIDRENFTTRPRTLSPNRFTATDALQDWSILRLGMRNRIITRRDGQNFDWLFLDTYIDAFFDDPTNLNRNFSNLYNDLRWNPLPWLAVSLESEVPVFDNGSGFTEYGINLQFMPTKNFEFSLGARSLNNHPVAIDSNRIDLRSYLRLNDNWGVGTTHVWELEDNTLEIQQYTISRDFNHWIASLGLTSRDNRIEEEYGVILAFTLKDFPSGSLPFRLDAP